MVGERSGPLAGTFRRPWVGATDGRAPLGEKNHQVVAGNLKVAEALQKVLVNTGYAAEFDAKF